LVLPSYASIGIAAPLLLMLCRGQGVGLGGEWVSRVVSYRERPNKRAWYGMFPQLGANWFVTFWWNFLDFNGYDEFPRFSGLWLEDSL
jgi:hypothetical protein